MSKGKNIKLYKLSAIFGIKTVNGTDNDDTIAILDDMDSCTRNSGTRIIAGNGDDIISIAGKMTGRGDNIIDVRDGHKTISVIRGLDAAYSGMNMVSAGNGTHYFRLGAIKSASEGTNFVKTGAGTDNIIITGRVDAEHHSSNNFTFGDGLKTLDISGPVYAQKGGRNTFSFGRGTHLANVEGDLEADCGGHNRIEMQDGNSMTIIRGDMKSDGLNEILFGGGEHKIAIQAIKTGLTGTNRITTDGSAEITVTDAMSSYHLNEITTGAGNDVISIRNGLYAFHGQNTIETGAGDDHVSISGSIDASSWLGGTNLLSTGAGNDRIDIRAHISTGSFMLNGGEGYDTLVLHADSHSQFKYHYQDWFTDFYSRGGIASSGLEAIRVDIGHNYGLDHIDWLTKLIDVHNASAPGKAIDVEINLDHATTSIDLNQLLTSCDKSIAGIDLRGENANIIQVTGPLDPKGENDHPLRINGDSNDAVTLGWGWHLSQPDFTHANGDSYHVYSNTFGEDLLIQSGMQVFSIV